MFRSWISRNATLLSSTNSRISYGHISTAENCLSACSPSWKLHDIAVQQKRLKHENVENAAHMVHHGDGVPLIDSTLGKLIGLAVEKWPEKECLVSCHQNVRLTFSECLRRSDRLAAGLLKLGLKSGDCIAIWGPNDVEWFLSFLAAARAGFILVALNPAYQLDELIYCIQKVDVRAVIAPDSFKTQDYPRMLFEAQRACPTLEHIIIYSKDHVTGARRFCDVETLASRIEIEGIAARQDEITCYDGNNIQFTSGSTGRPKATLLSHRSLVNNARQTVERSRYSLDNRTCLNVPFFHAFGVIKGLIALLHTGMTLVLASRSFDPIKSIHAMLSEKCNVAYGTPTMWINLLDAHERLQSPPITLASVVTGGAPASPELFKRIKKRRFCLDNIETIYGLTETTAVIFQSLSGEASELTETTVGHLASHVEAMVVNENGSVVSFGTPGELWIRGYCTMMRYWADEENTRKTLTEDGWLKTGDQFVLRQDGYGQIVGRLKDMLIRGGENIFPKEVEDFLMTHPLVLEAQVIGAYDHVYGEEICACVRLRDGARLTKEELRNYCKGKIAHFKIPRYVEFVDDYPKTTSGKVQKFKLKEEMQHRGVIPSAPVA
ncbi:acyl-CoA synthetase family member 2 [Calliopsis andreniformis]|uniref:acyl-CoA synthetase family member 2 n=1 Tax=Calliopsis andreniformis TaxID=337506 RepID=UPI003FCCC93C